MVLVAVFETIPGRDFVIPLLLKVIAKVHSQAIVPFLVFLVYFFIEPVQRKLI